MCFQRARRRPRALPRAHGAPPPREEDPRAGARRQEDLRPRRAALPSRPS